MNTLVAACVCLVVSAGALPLKSDTGYSYPFPFVTREEWGARPAGYRSDVEGPVPFVVLHHSYIPPACKTIELCKNYMALMQDMHQLTNGWEDIGYNFGVGGDGSVYEGRGWGIVGAHAVGYNSRSVGIVMIGDFVNNLPPENQLQAAKKLIAVGVELGYIAPDYQLIGHRQVSATECPGQALYDEMTSWEKFTPYLE